MAMRVLTRAMTMRRLQSPLVRALSTDVHAPTSLSAAVSETTDAGKSSDGDMDTLASVPISQATETHRLKFFAFAKEQLDELFPEGVGRRMEYTFDLVGHRHIMLRDTTLQILSMMKGTPTACSLIKACIYVSVDWETAKDNGSAGAFLIDGERGTGKSFALHQVVQSARESKWIVLYIPNPRSWCHEAPYVMQSPYQEGKFDIDVYGVDLLQKFLHCHGEQLRSIPLRGEYADRYYSTDKYETKPKNAADHEGTSLTLCDLVICGVRDEELACQAVCDLKDELAQTVEFPQLTISR
uniref:Small ribosomal subunit protein mS29 n=1 Tax=Hyaloperonospora arabidopsidis (strain Emoy2) TaxID=559515 RepID=M4BSU4_HYAAE